MPTTRVYSPTGWRALEANGASIADAAFAQADDAAFSLTTHGDDYPHLEMELVWAHGTAPTANSALVIFAQDVSVNGGNALAPSANNLRGVVATVLVTNTTSTQRARVDVIKAPTDANYWVHANGVTNGVSSGWTLRARAFTFSG